MDKHEVAEQYKGLVSLAAKEIYKYERITDESVARSAAVDVLYALQGHNEVDRVLAMVEDRLRALTEEASRLDALVETALKRYRGATAARPWDVREAGEQLESARQKAAYWKGRQEESEKTWVILKAHAQSEEK